MTNHAETLAKERVMTAIGLVQRNRPNTMLLKISRVVDQEWVGAPPEEKDWVKKTLFEIICYDYVMTSQGGYEPRNICMVAPVVQEVVVGRLVGRAANHAVWAPARVVVN
jgi:hypothetical protein